DDPRPDEARQRQLVHRCLLPAHSTRVFGGEARRDEAFGVPWRSWSTLRSMRARILIVGGGIMGVSTALKCAPRTRESVLLIERKHIGAGSSGRSGAILRQHYRDAEVARMARDSLREYGRFEAETGLPLGFQRTGVLTLAGPDQSDWCQRIRENVAMLRGLGIETELVD